MTIKPLATTAAPVAAPPIIIASQIDLKPTIWKPNILQITQVVTHEPKKIEGNNRRGRCSPKTDPLVSSQMEENGS